MENQFVSNFYEDSKPLENGPLWGLSYKASGSMRFRWNETNQNRIEYLNKVAEGREVCSIELIHSKIVYDINSSNQLTLKQGDGIITSNKNLLPVVTVADCMPIYLFDSEKQVFGVLHSGWKGTGIVEEAIELCKKNYGSNVENIHIVLGPHINDCCYIVDQNRADYFIENFGANCVTPLEDKYKLSLRQANLNAIKRSGVLDKNVFCAKECTCCSSHLGSFRRQTMNLPQEMTLEEKQKLFTPMAAWIKW